MLSVLKVAAAERSEAVRWMRVLGSATIVGRGYASKPLHQIALRGRVLSKSLELTDSAHAAYNPNTPADLPEESGLPVRF